MKHLFRSLCAAAVFLAGSHALGCLQAPFDIKVSDPNTGSTIKLATILGKSITSDGWKQFSEGQTRDGKYRVTRYSNPGVRSLNLVRFVATGDNQPGVKWGVWSDGGIVEGYSRFYEIRTDVRGIGRDARAKVRDKGDGVFEVTCEYE